MFAVEGFVVRNLPTESYVVEEKSGTVYARVKEVSSGTLQIEGDFWINGLNVRVNSGEMIVNTNLLAGNIMVGFGKAICVERGGFGIGFR